MSSRPIAVDNPELRALPAGEAHFSSITFRCFKAEGLERTAEDYGHVAVYRGGVVGAGSVFVLDSTNAFELKDRPRLVPVWQHCDHAGIIAVRAVLHGHGLARDTLWGISQVVHSACSCVWPRKKGWCGGSLLVTGGSGGSVLLHCMQSCMCPMVFVSFTLVENLFLIT